MNELNKALKTQKSTNEGLEKKNAEVNGKCDKLKELLERAKLELQAKSKAANVLEEKNEDLNMQIVETSLVTSSPRREDVEKNAKLNEECKNLKAELECVKKELTAKTSAVDKLEKKNINLKLQIDMRLLNASTDSEDREKNQEVEKLRAEFEQMKTDYEELRKQLEDKSKAEEVNHNHMFSGPEIWEIEN